MTYSIVARDPDTGEMGIACQSQAFAVGSSVPWAEAGFGVIATQSIAEPFYGELGLDLLRGGLTAAEALTSLRSIDAHAEQRQIAMIDGRGGVEVHTGDRCIGAAGHRIGNHCVALANMAASEAVWDAMVTAFETTTGRIATRLIAALRAAEAEGGDFRGRRSAAVTVVRSTRTGRPWQDRVVDLRVDDHDDPVEELAALVGTSERYHQGVRAFEQALEGSPDQALEVIEALGDLAEDEPDLLMRSTVVHALAGRDDEAAAQLAELQGRSPAMVELIRRFEAAEVIPRLGAVTPPGWPPPPARGPRQGPLARRTRGGR